MITQNSSNYRQQGMLRAIQWQQALVIQESEKNVVRPKWVCFSGILPQTYAALSLPNFADIDADWSVLLPRNVPIGF